MLSYAEASKHLTGVAARDLAAGRGFHAEGRKNHGCRSPPSGASCAARLHAAGADLRAVGRSSKCCVIAGAFLHAAHGRRGDRERRCRSAAGAGAGFWTAHRDQRRGDGAALADHRSVVQNTLHFADGQRGCSTTWCGCRSPISRSATSATSSPASSRIEPIRNVLAEGLITAVDRRPHGASSRSTMIFIYSPLLGAGRARRRSLLYAGAAPGALPAVPRAQRGGHPQQGAGKLDSSSRPCAPSRA